MNMEAYNFRFEETGVTEIDKILSAVASAARLYHNCTDWITTDEVDGHTGDNPVTWIQNAAHDAAKIFKKEGQKDQYMSQKKYMETQENNNKEAFLRLNEQGLYFAGLNSPDVTDAMRADVLPRLTEYFLLRAGTQWPGITDAMRAEAFPRLTWLWLYEAGLCWPGITDTMRAEAFLRLTGKWLYAAGLCWPGITDAMRADAFPRLKEEWSDKAKKYWSGI